MCRPSTGSGARSKDKLRLVLVVASTPKGNVLDRRAATLRVGLLMMELQERTLGTPVSVVRDEGALAAVASYHASFHVTRNMA